MSVRYRYAVIAILVLSLSLPGLAGAQGLGQTFSWPEFGLTMNYPDGWVEMGDAEARVLSSDPNFDFTGEAIPTSPGVIITVFPFIVEMDPAAVFGMFLGEFDTSETFQPESATIAGFDALRVGDLAPVPGITMEAIFITTDANYYLFIGFAPTGQNLTTLLDSMLATVEISAAQPVPGPALTTTGGQMVNAVRITLDQTLVGSWNEIDAVQLVGKDASGAQLSQWAVRAEASSSYGEDSWSAMQATGAPNVTRCIDSTSAWASRGTSGIETLTLFYSTPVEATEVSIYQTYNPGAIVRVELLPADGSAAIIAFSGVDPTTACPGIFTIPIVTSTGRRFQSGQTAVDGVRISLDQTLTNNWNEIDAVELVGLDADGTLMRQWGATAEASSSYSPSSWSASQATGAPNVNICGDAPSAWASATSTGRDTLTIHYWTPVIPTEVNIYQTYNPGAIVRVELLPADGSLPLSIFEGVDPTTACPGILSIPVTLGGEAGPTDDASFVDVGEISAASPFEDWEFDGLAGKTVTISMLATGGGSLDPYLILLGPDGRELATNDDASALNLGIFDAQIADFVLPQDGVYTIRATRYGEEYGSSVGPYELRMQFGTPEPVEATPIAFGQTVRGTISEESFKQYWSFEGAAGDTVAITMVDVSTGRTLDPYLILTDAIGVTLIENDDATSASVGLWDAQITGFRLPLAGTYIIQATRYGESYGSSYGEYELTLTRFK